MATRMTSGHHDLAILRILIFLAEVSGQKTCMILQLQLEYNLDRIP